MISYEQHRRFGTVWERLQATTGGPRHGRQAQVQSRAHDSRQAHRQNTTHRPKQQGLRVARRARNEAVTGRGWSASRSFPKAEFEHIGTVRERPIERPSAARSPRRADLISGLSCKGQELGITHPVPSASGQCRAPGNRGAVGSPGASPEKSPTDRGHFIYKYRYLDPLHMSSCR